MSLSWFCMWCEVGVQFHSVACGFSSFLTQPLEQQPLHIDLPRPDPQQPHEGASGASPTLGSCQSHLLPLPPQWAHEQVQSTRVLPQQWPPLFTGKCYWSGWVTSPCSPVQTSRYPHKKDSAGTEPMLLGFLKLAQWSSVALLAHVGHLLKCTLLLRANEPSLGTQRTDVSGKPLILTFATAKRQRRQCPRTGPSWVTVGTQATPLDFRA